ncbi:kinase [Jannaschia formosa]|nr:kinase [Jannaschia formosa]
MQEDVLAFLASGAAFPDGGAVTRIETHGAYVFLCGGDALKLKRAVRYDYMDLSTPDLRRRMLLRELELNAPSAPSIYRDVLPVTRKPGGLLIGGDGPVIDWVLRMHRFPAENELEAVAARGALDGPLADALGRMVLHYHANCPQRLTDGAELMSAILDELDRVFTEFKGAEGTEGLADWRRATRQVFSDASARLTRRGLSGHTMRTHGDLHLRNIVLVDAKPVAFDALEFDETLGTCDVLYDLAFLLMDLEHRGLNAVATRTLSQYLLEARGSEDAGLAVLPLFLSVRAAIRAMVLLQTDVARKRAGASAVEVQAYLTQARAVLTPHPARLIAVGGLSGSGKTVLARDLAPGLGAAPGAVHLSTDAERKAGLEQPANCHLEQAAYAPAARQGVYVRLLARAEAILRAGHGVVLDGTFLDPLMRHAVRELAVRLDVPSAFLWLNAPESLLLERIGSRRNDSSDADAAVLRRQLACDLGPMDWTRIDASGAPVETLAAARAVLAAGRP